MAELAYKPRSFLYARACALSMMSCCLLSPDQGNLFKCKQHPGTMDRYLRVMGRPRYLETTECHHVEKGNCMRTTPSPCLDTLSTLETGHGSLCCSGQLCSSARSRLPKSGLLTQDWRGRMNERGQAAAGSPT